QLLLARVGNEPVALRLLARELARAADRLGLFPVFALRRLFIGAPLLHFTKHAFTLHFLFQNTESLIDIVVAHKNLQLMFLCLEARRTHAKTMRFEPYAPHVRRHRRDYASASVS